MSFINLAGEAETHWENLKDKMKSLYFLALGRDPGLGDFKVFVDVGDVREVGRRTDMRVVCSFALGWFVWWERMIYL